MKDSAPDGINGDTTPHNKARRMAPMGVFELKVASHTASYLLYQCFAKTKEWPLSPYQYSCTSSSIHQTPSLVVEDEQMDPSSFLLLASLALALALPSLSLVLPFSFVLALASLLLPSSALGVVLHISLLKEQEILVLDFQVINSKYN